MIKKEKYCNIFLSPFEKHLLKSIKDWGSSTASWLIGAGLTLGNTDELYIEKKLDKLTQLKLLSVTQRMYVYGGNKVFTITSLGKKYK